MALLLFTFIIELIYYLFSICAQQTADSVNFLSKVRFFQRVKESGVLLGPIVRFFPKGPGSGFSLGSGPGPRSLFSNMPCRN